MKQKWRRPLEIVQALDVGTRQRTDLLVGFGILRAWRRNTAR